MWLLAQDSAIGGDEGGLSGLFFWTIVFMLIFGGIGSWVGGRYHNQRGMGFVAGMMCGPLGSIVMAMFPAKGYPFGSSKCRFCKSVLNHEATVCHHCGRDQKATVS